MRRDRAGPRSRSGKSVKIISRRCGSSSTVTVAAGTTLPATSRTSRPDAAATRPRLPTPAGTGVHTDQFPRAASTTAFGINDIGEIAGYYTDAAGNTDGFVHGLWVCEHRDVEGPRYLNDTYQELERAVTGLGTDALTGQHGLIGR